MGAISIQVITKELTLACRQLGHVLSETLAALVVSTIIDPNVGSFYVERPIDESDARLVVEEAAKRILSKEEPGITTLRLQAAYEHAFAQIESESQRTKVKTQDAEERLVSKVSNFSAKFDQDFDTLTGLYKQIYFFLMLRCTAPSPRATIPKDTKIEREVAAALESVFPRVGLRSFVALTGPEKAAQLQELAGIVLGIRVFNQHQNKGGAGLPTAQGSLDRLKSEELLQKVQTEIEAENETCKEYASLIAASIDPPSGRGPSESEVARARSDLLYHRQYMGYLLNLQEDLSGSIGRLKKDTATLTEELTDLEALVGGRVSVPKEQVYPRFDAAARCYKTAMAEVQTLESRAKLHAVLVELRNQYFPKLGEHLLEIIDLRQQLGVEDDEADPDELDAIPGPNVAANTGGAMRLTVENSPEFLQLPLDFQGFCIHSLVTGNRCLVPGNPALGVIKYAGRYCVFATGRAVLEFCAEPDRFFTGVREVCYTYPELIHLLRIHDDFPASSVHSIIQSSATNVVMQADVGTETPLHFQESNIDKTYEWNEWKLRRNALHMADIKNKSTSATQTGLSHLRRENETQVYLPKEIATNTMVNQGTNPERWKKYYAHLRGEAQPMKVVDIKFDL